MFKGFPLEVVLVQAFGAAILFHFGCMVKYGNFYIQEPNGLILWSEITAISGLMFVVIVRYLRNKGGKFEGH